MLEEKIIAGVLHWRESPENDWTPWDVRELSARAAVNEVAMAKKNERIRHLCDHINQLQKIITQQGGPDLELYGDFYLRQMYGTPQQPPKEAKT